MITVAFLITKDAKGDVTVVNTVETDHTTTDAEKKLALAVGVGGAKALLKECPRADRDIRAEGADMAASFAEAMRNEVAP